MWTKYQIMLEGRTVQEEHLRAPYPQQICGKGQINPTYTLHGFQMSLNEQSYWEDRPII